MEQTKGTQIITGNDVYFVSESFDEVEAAWQAAVLFEQTAETS